MKKCKNAKMDCGRSAFPLKERNANRIVGGWEANPHSIPWQVYIEVINFTNFLVCGGSIIQLQPDKIKTVAAHAVSVISGMHTIFCMTLPLYSFTTQFFIQIILALFACQKLTVPFQNTIAGSLDGAIATGDSGGPFFCRNNNIYTLYGVASFRPPFAAPGTLTSYVRVSSHFVKGEFKCGKPAFPMKEHSGNRIINGWEAYPHSIPWQVFLAMYTSEGDTFCGGTIIQPHHGNSTNFVLTAAHCLQITDSLTNIISPKNVYVMAGVHNVDDENEISRTVLAVEKIINHFNFTMHRPYDISLLKLKSPIFYTRFARPICLPEANSTVPEHDCWSSGWGYTTSIGKSSSVLLMVATPLFKLGKYFPFELFNEYEFLAGSLKGGGFLGDSGGPLFCKVNGIYFLYGIASFYPHFTFPGSLMGYSKVTAFIDWIQETTKM
ncbi:Coagulation factor XI [Trichinella pseudospiralis]|uniref:Coagulation factor XI n=1 Tax=Trichinella pseudospiralis TaxID=6337 RepID=A0A0V1HQW9_TRIPS|nr:Coagulation factor XI [Trichinella pseudospiralis]